MHMGDESILLDVLLLVFKRHIEKDFSYMNYITKYRRNLYSDPTKV